jgi:O-glycosyl hydrolase
VSIKELPIDNNKAAKEPTNEMQNSALDRSEAQRDVGTSQLETEQIYAKKFFSEMQTEEEQNADIEHLASPSGAASEASAKQGQDITTFTIDLSKQFQTIDNFGASDAWSCQFVGHWPEAKRTAIADLLFSTSSSSTGKPNGIGLSLWRFNLGAGSAQQGDSSGITDEWRRAESFIGNNGEYDWDLQAGQMWFLKAAKDRGVNQFLAFCNSPLVSLTVNGKAFATGGNPNLEKKNFDAFANYLVNVVKGVKNKIGVTFDYLSPANEPQWDWGGGQEGTPFMNEDIAGIVKSLDAAITKEKISSKIAIVEAGQYNFLYSAHGKPRRGTQIDAFFTPGSDTYIGNLPSVENVIMGHGYFTTSPYNTAVQVRDKLHNKVKQVNGLKLWQSEYCILGDNNGEINGEHRDLGIKPAMYLAQVLHNDLVNANVSAWHWWTALSAYDYKDGLIYVDKEKSDGNFQTSKMLWALGNFSRFIRPGSVRVSASTLNQSEILASAYVSNGELVVVLINPTLETKEVKLELVGATMQTATAYVTSTSTDLEPNTISSATDTMKLQALSVTSFVSKLTLPSYYKCCLI